MVENYEPKAPGLGIIPSDIPHGSEKINGAHDVSYKYLNKKEKRGFPSFSLQENRGNAISG